MKITFAEDARGLEYPAVSAPVPLESNGRNPVESLTAFLLSLLAGLAQPSARRLGESTDSTCNLSFSMKTKTNALIETKVCSVTPTLNQILACLNCKVKLLNLSKSTSNYFRPLILNYLNMFK